MPAHAYTEDQLVEQPAIQLFKELGWQAVSALDEIFGAKGTFGRETPSEVVLESPLRAAFERLNPALPQEAITAAVDELTLDRSAMSLEAANREVYLLLKEGIKVSVPDRERGGQKTERLRVVDWEHPVNNDFLLVSQFSVTGALYTCRPDLVCFVNGLPLVVIELAGRFQVLPGRPVKVLDVAHNPQAARALGELPRLELVLLAVVIDDDERPVVGLGRLVGRRRAQRHQPGERYTEQSRPLLSGSHGRVLNRLSATRAAPVSSWDE